MYIILNLLTKVVGNYYQGNHNHPNFLFFFFIFLLFLPFYVYLFINMWTIPQLFKNYIILYKFCIQLKPINQAFKKFSLGVRMKIQFSKKKKSFHKNLNRISVVH